jgi:hypothetical protein
VREDLKNHAIRIKSTGLTVHFAHSTKRKAKTGGVKKEGREEQEAEEGKKLPLTAAPSALQFPLSRPS